MGHWQAIALSWVLALLIVGIGYALWAWLGGEPIHWASFGLAALLGGSGAVLLMAWRGVRGRLTKEDEMDQDQSEGGDE